MSVRHRRRRAGDAHQRRRVEGRQMDLAVARGQERQDLRLRQRHRQHGAGVAHLLDQAPALGHQLEGRLEGEDAGHHRRRVLAEAVAEHRRGDDPPGAEQAGEGDLDEQQGRLGDGGARQLPPRLLLAAGGRVEDLAQVEPQARREMGRGAVDLVAEQGLGLVEVAPHPHVLAPLAGEDEGHRAPRLRPAAGRPRPAQQPHRIARRQAGRGVRGVAADQGPPGVERPAAGGEGVGGVGQIDIRGPRQVPGQPLPRRRQGLRGAGREGQQLPGAGAEGGLGRRRLLQDHVGVGAAEAEGIHPGPPRPSAPSPGQGASAALT